MSNNNGNNAWGVPFSDITWFERLLQNHDNVTNIQRHDDIIFEIDRTRQSDHLKIMCCRQYTMSITLVQKALSDFGKLNIIYIGGGWNSYDTDAKLFCIQQRIGLYTTPEMSGGLWENDYWSYEKPD
ncbi:hypothetical protein GCM10027082_20760 [Comamonas humi]